MKIYPLIIQCAFLAHTYAMEPPSPRTPTTAAIRSMSPFIHGIKVLRRTDFTLSQQNLLKFYDGTIRKQQQITAQKLLSLFLFKNEILNEQQKLLLIKAVLVPRLVERDREKFYEQRNPLADLAYDLPREEYRAVIKRMPSIEFEWDGT